MSSYFSLWSDEGGRLQIGGFAAFRQMQSGVLTKTDGCIRTCATLKVRQYGFAVFECRNDDVF